MINDSEMARCEGKRTMAGAFLSITSAASRRSLRAHHTVKLERDGFFMNEKRPQGAMRMSGSGAKPARTRGARSGSFERLKRAVDSLGGASYSIAHPSCGQSWLQLGRNHGYCQMDV